MDVVRRAVRLAEQVGDGVDHRRRSPVAQGQLPIEHWFEAAIERNETQPAMEIAERIRRRRFFGSDRGEARDRDEVG